MGYKLRKQLRLVEMANHKSSIKRIRQAQVKRLHNRYFAKTARNAVRDLRETTEKDAAVTLYSKVSSMLDKLAKRNIIHKNKAANLKSKLAKNINKL
jgi:small subunit ribosomal protein S20